jgi:hypothetical protein
MTSTGDRSRPSSLSGTESFGSNHSVSVCGAGAWTVTKDSSPVSSPEAKDQADLPLAPLSSFSTRQESRSWNVSRNCQSGLTSNDRSNQTCCPCISDHGPLIPERSSIARPKYSTDGGQPKRAARTISDGTEDTFDPSQSQSERSAPAEKSADSVMTKEMKRHISSGLEKRHTFEKQLCHSKVQAAERASSDKDTSRAQHENEGESRRREKRKQQDRIRDSSTPDDHNRKRKRSSSQRKGVDTKHTPKACPFWKYDPSIYGANNLAPYRACAGPGFPTIAKLK